MTSASATAADLRASMEAVADAYVWGFPLVAMHRTCAGHGGVGAGLVTRDRLATAADRTVVAPNNDTLYASGWYDLRAGDLVLSVDAMDRPDRYWSVMLLDAYTHVTYVSRRTHGRAGTRVRVTLAGDGDGHGSDDDGSDDDGVVAIGTPTVWVLARVLVDGPHDLDAARAALTRIDVAQPGATPVPRPIVGGDGGDGGGGFFGELRTALAVDPPAPWHPPAPPLPAHGVDQAAGIREGKARMARATGVDRTGNGWGTRSRGADFGDDVAYRAAFARVSLAGHLPAENRSYSRPFDGSTRAELCFPAGGEPPVDGFWSLCVYGPDMFFVANTAGRYSVGDRTPGLRRGDDGSLTISLGADRPADAANWLPMPPGPCVLVLRAYEGRPDVAAARWFPPDLTRPAHPA